MIEVPQSESKGQLSAQDDDSASTPWDSDEGYAEGGDHRDEDNDDSSGERKYADSQLRDWSLAELRKAATELELDHSSCRRRWDLIALIEAPVSVHGEESSTLSGGGGEESSTASGGVAGGNGERGNDIDDCHYEDRCRLPGGDTDDNLESHDGNCGMPRSNDKDRSDNDFHVTLRTLSLAELQVVATQMGLDHTHCGRMALIALIDVGRSLSNEEPSIQDDVHALSLVELRTLAERLQLDHSRCASRLEVLALIKVEPFAREHDRSGTPDRDAAAPLGTPEDEESYDSATKDARREGRRAPAIASLWSLTLPELRTLAERLGLDHARCRSRVEVIALIKAETSRQDRRASEEAEEIEDSEYYGRQPDGAPPEEDIEETEYYSAPLDDEEGHEGHGVTVEGDNAHDRDYLRSKLHVPLSSLSLSKLRALATKLELDPSRCHRNKAKVIALIEECTLTTLPLEEGSVQMNDVFAASGHLGAFNSSHATEEGFVGWGDHDGATPGGVPFRSGGALLVLQAPSDMSVGKAGRGSENDCHPRDQRNDNIALVQYDAFRFEASPRFRRCCSSNQHEDPNNSDDFVEEDGSTACGASVGWDSHASGGDSNSEALSHGRWEETGDWDWWDDSDSGSVGSSKARGWRAISSV